MVFKKRPFMTSGRQDGTDFLILPTKYKEQP